MITRRTLLISGLLASAAPALARSASKTGGALAGPPLARVAPITDVYWGQAVTDPYRWMETRPETTEWTTWLKGQADYAAAQLAALPQRAAIQQAIERYSADTSTVAVVQTTAAHVYYYLITPEKQSAALWRRPIGGGTAALLFDPEPLGKPGQPANITYCSASPDERYLAYGLDSGGNEIEALHIRTIATGEDRLVTPINTRSSDWLPDSSGYLYMRFRADAVFGSTDYSKGASVWLHRMADHADIEMFRSGEGPGGADLYDVSNPVIKTFPGSDHLLAVHMINGNTPGAIYVARIADVIAGKTPWQQVAWTEDLAGDSQPTEPIAAAIIGDDIYVLARGKASNGEIWKVQVAAPDRANRRVVVPEGAGAIDRFCAARDGLYIHETRGGIAQLLKRYSFASGASTDVAVPREGSIWNMVSAPDQPGLWFGMDGLTWPAVTLATGADLMVRDTGLTPQPDYDTSRYVSERFEVTARDGRDVPAELLRARSTAPTGNNPTLIMAYGAYGARLDPGFAPSVLAWLDAGGIMVYAYVRGGGEKGDAWHRAGQKATKPNTWRDAIDTAEHLVKAGWTSPRHLALWGISAGGIMVGRAITERPDLFAAAVGEVGAFNVLRFELTANGPGNDVEFGTVKKEDEFRALLAMDAYHHVTNGTRYPAVLCITGANDLRVEPWQVGKFAARLQAASTSGPPVLLRVDYGSGHFASAKQAGIEKRADMYAFLLRFAGKG